MGILSKLFGFKPTMDKWPAISADIAGGLEVVRKRWFETGVSFLEDATKGDKPLQIKIVCRTLGGEADSAIKAYQLLLTSGFLAQHSYIPRPDGKDFADILYAQVCGTNIRETMRYLERYIEVQQDRGTQLFRLASDIARYITGSEASLAESMILTSIIPIYVDWTHMAVAYAFRDHNTLRELRSKVRSV